MISMICAMSKNRVIGKDGELAWYIPEDLAHFKEITMGKTVVMGRRTYDSIGKALPGRKNVVITGDPRFDEKDVSVIRNIEEVFLEKGDIVIIGGQTLYEQMLEYAETIYLTEIDEEFDGDTYFPVLNEEWEIVSKKNSSDDNYSYTFKEYKRTKNKFWEEQEN